MKAKAVTINSTQTLLTVVTNNSVSLSVPIEIETKMLAAIHQRLAGLTITVNGRLAVS